MTIFSTRPHIPPTSIPLRDALVVLLMDTEVKNASRWNVISRVLGDGKHIVVIRQQEVAKSEALINIIRTRNPELASAVDAAGLHGASEATMEKWISENEVKFSKVSVEIGELAQTLNLSSVLESAHR